MSENDAAVRPDWLDDDFLKICIRNSNDLPQSTDIDVKNVLISYAVPKGENYMSLIYRVNVVYYINKKGKPNTVQNGNAGDSLSLIIKARHETEQLKQLAKQVRIFEKETDMLVNIMPKLRKTLADAGLDGVLSCRCLHSITDDERDILVMEDLTPQGYVLANRLTGLDLQHCKVVLDKHAKLHASSMFYYQNNEVPEWYKISPFSNRGKSDDGAMKRMFDDSMPKKVAEVIEELQRYPHYGKHIEFYKQYVKLNGAQVQRGWDRVPGNKFNAILHGDCWVNNFLFKYNDNGSVEDVMLIDLQISYCSSIANDFLFFFFTSSNKEVRKHHFKTLQKYYLDSLVGNLQKLGFKGDLPTLDEFEAELKRVGLVVIFLITLFISFILADIKDSEKDRSKSAAFTVDEMTNLESSTHMEVLRLSIDVLEEHGFFDAIDLTKFMN